MSAALRKAAPGRNPRLGFLGTGWIGRSRMEAVLGAKVGEVVAIADPSPEMLAEAAKSAPDARCVDGLDGLLAAGVDAVVIATPSALHASQAIRALEGGAAVFCQKPLGRTAAEVEAILDAARAADRPVGVDFSYRSTAAFREVKKRIESGVIGRVFAADLVFHNAYGPDKPWFYDPALSGGGCVIDLGVHLVDLALWTLGFPKIEQVSSRLYSGGARLAAAPEVVEDFATATIETAEEATIQLACSWRLHAGVDAEIAAVFHGTEGGLAFRNVGGSFYDFEALLFRGTSSETLASPPDAWSGRALVEWAAMLGQKPGFDPAAAQFLESARALDAIYGR